MIGISKILRPILCGALLLGMGACSVELMPEPSVDVRTTVEAVFEIEDLTGEFDVTQLDEKTDVVIKFSRGVGKYAFDTAEEGWYKTALLLRDYYKPFGEGYMAPWKLVPVGETDTVEATIAEGRADAEDIKFVLKDGTGVPAKYDGGKWTLNLSAVGSGETYEVFAVYEKGRKLLTVGKLNVVSHPTQTHTVTLVPVYEPISDVGSVERELNAIYAPYGVTIKVEVDDTFRTAHDWQWDLDGDNRLNINGSGFFTGETDEMRALRRAYQSAGNYDRNAYYMFVMREAKADTEPNSAAAGDMPRGKQFGYLFGSLDARLIAHELGHGIFTLHHTFDNNYGGGASQGRTANLMDYARGVDLGAFQWSVMANPAPLTWFDSEEDAMAIYNISKEISLEGRSYAYPTPSGIVINIPNIKTGHFSQDGALVAFTLANGDAYDAVYGQSTNRFYGYILDKYHKQVIGDYKDTTASFIGSNKFTGYQLAATGDEVFAIAQGLNMLGEYIENCWGEYEWINSSRGNAIEGSILNRVVPNSASELRGCFGDSVDATGVNEGIGRSLYNELYSLVRDDEEKRIELCELANELSTRLAGQRFAIYSHEYGLEDELVLVDPQGFSDDALEVFHDLELISRDKFNSVFKQLQHGASDCAIILSTEDLWEEIDYENYNGASVDWTKYSDEFASAGFSVPTIRTEEEFIDALDRLEFIVVNLLEEPDAIGAGDDYNNSVASLNNILNYIYECTDNPDVALSNSPHLQQTFKNIYAYLGAYQRYSYTFSDLIRRYRVKEHNDDGFIFGEILKNEMSGAAAPISQSGATEQYIAYYETESAFYLGEQYYAMIGTVYALDGARQAIAGVGRGIQNIISQRGAVRAATSRLNLLNTRIEYQNRSANTQRLTQDRGYEAYRQREAGGKATPSRDWAKQNIGRDRVQNQAKDDICKQLDDMPDIRDIRVNQTQSSARENALGLNRPDIQFTYNNRRFYIEIDAAVSNRGAGHMQRIIANDPSASSNSVPTGLQNIRVSIGGQTYRLTGDVTLIQLP